jgi:SP family xylose:H+ symportor-like MFS transporter
MHTILNAHSSEAVGHHNRGYVWIISSVAALGGLLFGYDWVVIGGARPFYEPYFNLTSEILIGWATSCALVGCFLGSMVCGALSDTLGRKKLLILSATLFTVSSLNTGWAHSFSAFVIWRVVGGMAIGMASNVSPMYIAEVSPAAWRGRLVTLNQLAIVVGLLAAQIVNWMIAQPVPPQATADLIRDSWNGQFGWRWMFIVVAIPSVLFLVGALFIPESPRWLVKQGNIEAAWRILSRIGGDAHGTQALNEIHASLGVEAQTGAAWRELPSPVVRAALAMGIILAVLQQWSGINVIFSYAEDIYRSGGYGVSGSLLNIIITGAINLVFTLIALRWVDQIGRRTLMLYGCAGIAVSHVFLGTAYALGITGPPVLLLTLCTIACYAATLAPVTWVLISEIFPGRIRGIAVAISVSALWVACFLATFTFPILNRQLGTAGTFWSYGVVCVAGYLYVLRHVRETKGLTLEQIERRWIEGSQIEEWCE